MDWTGLISGFFSNAASGGILGIAGSLVSVWAKGRQAKIDHERRKEEFAHELALQKLQIEQGDRETENELAIARESAIGVAKEASYRIDMGQGTSQWVRDIRGLFRLALTAGLWLMIPTLLAALRYMLGAEAFAGIITVELIVYMVESVVFTASTATLWWFGDRAFTPPNLKHR